MNLNNITIGKTDYTSNDGIEVFPYYKHDQYLPLFKLPRLNINTSDINTSGDTSYSLYRYGGGINSRDIFNNGFDYFNYILYSRGARAGSGTRIDLFNIVSKENYKGSIFDYMYKVEAFINGVYDKQHISLHADYVFKNDFISGLFYNTPNTVRIRKYVDCIPNIRKYTIVITKNECTLVMAAGTVLLLKEDRLIPLVMLMIDKSYIREYCFTNIVDFNVDKTKFQWWINSEIENYGCFSFLDKVIFSKGNASGINIAIKGNVEKYFNKPSLPSFNNIVDRLKFMESLKQDFMANDDTIVLDIPKVELTDINNFKYKSKHLNSFIHSLHNQYTLTE